MFLNLAVFFVVLVPNIWIFPVFILLLYLSVGREVLKGTLKKGRPQRTDLLVFFLLVLCSLSFLDVDLRYRSPQNYLRYYLGSYLFPALAYFAFRLIPFSGERARSLRRTVMISGLLFSISCLFEFFFSHPLAPEFDNPGQWIDDRVFRAGTLAGGSIHAGEIMASLVALTLPQLLFRRNNNYRLSALPLLLLLVSGLAVTFSRAGYISALASLIAAVLLQRGIRIKAFLISAGVLLALSSSLLFFTLPDWFSQRLIAPDSTLVRIPRFWAGVDFIADNFAEGWQTALFGKGYISSYLGGGYYMEPGYAETLSPEDVIAGSYFLGGGFHNGYLTLIADQGALAFLCYAAILVIAIRTLWRHGRCLRSQTFASLPPDLIEPIGWGLIIVVHMVTETVHWSTYFPQRFYFFMALAMLLNLTSSLWRGQAPRTDEAAGSRRG